jgi:hypothetical protein
MFNGTLTHPGIAAELGMPHKDLELLLAAL